MSRLAEPVGGDFSVVSVGPSRGGRLPWAPRPDGLRGPCWGSRALVLGSILPRSRPHADAKRGQCCAWQPPARPGVGWKGSACSSCLALFLAAFVSISALLPTAPHWAGETLWALPPICPPPCRGCRLGLVPVPRDWFGDSRDCLESGCGGIQPIHPQSSPAAQLRAVEHPRAPAQRGGTSPVSSLSMSLLCVSALPVQSVPWGTQQATCEYARDPGQVAPTAALLSQALTLVFFPAGGGLGSSGWEDVPLWCGGCDRPQPRSCSCSPALGLAVQCPCGVLAQGVC